LGNTELYLTHIFPGTMLTNGRIITPPNRPQSDEIHTSTIIVM